MIWIICAIITILLIALAIRAYADKKIGSLRVFPVLLCLFVATYVIYIPAFLNSYDAVSAITGNLIHVLQVITIDADFMQYYEAIRDGVSSSFFAGVYTIILGFLHVAMPAVSALSAVTVLFRCFSSVQMFFANKGKRKMFIFSEVNERSLQLAKSLSGIKCDIIFASSDEEALNEANESKTGYIFREESIADINLRMKKKKNIYLFCISENEDENLSCVLSLIDKLNGIDISKQKNIHIYQFSKYEDYSVFIDSADKGALDVQCINEYEMLVYNLLDRYPLFCYGDDKIHVLLHGLSPVNVVALKAIAWCGQLSGFTLRISVIGVDIKQQIEELKLTVPGLFTDRYSIDFYDCISEKEVIDIISEKCSDANYIIVSDETDNKTMDRSLALRRLFYRFGGDFTNCPPIFCYIRDPAKYSIVQNLSTAESNPKRKMSYQLTPFGNLADVYSYEKLIDSVLENLSKNVHLAYEEIFSDGEIDVDDALSRYAVFEVNKRSNRANALHIRYKLRALGLDYTDDMTAEEVNSEEFFTDDGLERLSVSEHDRWMAFLETEGWTPATCEEVHAYRESGISKGRHNCPILKMHPYICAFEELKELSLELEGKDTTVYDRELIVRIPDILGDKWNVAGKKYKIIRFR